MMTSARGRRRLERSTVILTRGAVDLDEINHALLEVVGDTVQPQTATVWLRPEGE